MKIGMFKFQKHYGGTYYENMVMNALSKKHNVKMYSLIIEKEHLLKMTRIRQLCRLLKIKESKDIWIRTFLPIISLNFTKTKGINIALFHHIDNKECPHYLLNIILEKLYYKNLKKANAIVVVSNYWKNHLESRNYKNIHIIYNAFNLRDFNFNEKECKRFKEKYSLNRKPIIYIGNCQKRKGVVESYKSLRRINAYLVTSGHREVNLPCRNLYLTYREYLLLLKVSSVVVVMSRFKEGWCRTAHEALLCRTPVIGSGAGGMRELLEGGNQLICDEFVKLPSLVREVIKNSEQIGNDGYTFASQFSIERFENEWLSLIARLS